MTDFDKIRDDAIQRKIRRLCHFTQSRKLPHILGEPGGIFSIEWLEKNRQDIIDKNDPIRLDGYPNFISCSIEYPNTWYLDKAKTRDVLFKDWSILLIKPEVLWNPNTIFAFRNAAALKGKIKGGFEEFLKMFSPSIPGAYGKIFKRKDSHLLSCPTDGQAEVLVFEKIPIEFIIGIVFKNEEHAKIEIARLTTLKINFNQMKFVIASHCFDHSWRPLIEIGKIPKEVIFNSDEINA